MNTRWDGGVMVRWLFKYWNSQESCSHDSADKVYDGINRLIDEISTQLYTTFQTESWHKLQSSVFSFYNAVGAWILIFHTVELHSTDTHTSSAIFSKINTLITNDRLIRSTDTYFCPLSQTLTYRQPCFIWKLCVISFSQLWGNCKHLTHVPSQISAD